jgi:PilZ domain
MKSEHRKDRRYYVSQRARMAHADGSLLGHCTVVDFSATGARLKPDEGVEVPDQFLLLLSWTGNLHRECSVAWRANAVIGVTFVFDRKIKSKSTPAPAPLQN